MSVLLTGATGLIGTQVLQRLVTRGDHVRALVRPETLSQPDKVWHLKRHDQVELMAGDVTDLDVVGRAVQGVETIYHLAAVLPRRDVRRQDMISSNVHGTECLLRAAVAGGVGRLVLTSSVALYAPTPLPAGEEAILRRRGLYSATKLEAENLVHHYHGQRSLECVILRLSPVYGPGAEFIEGQVEWMLRRPLAALLQGGETEVQWIHVRDAAAAVVLAGTRSEAAGNVFNIAGNEAVTRGELIRIVHTLARYGSWDESWPVRSSMWRRAPLKYDISKAQTLLRFAPKVTLQEGLAEIIDGLNVVMNG